MVVKIDGQRMYLWRAVDDEGEVLDVLVQKRRNKVAALKLLRRLLKNQGLPPEAIVTDGLGSYRAAAKILGLSDRHRPSGMREITGRKTPIWRSDDESESSRSSSPRAQPKGSSPATPRSTTPSTPSLTCSLVPAFAL
jgi:transposase-like protein